MLHFVCLPGLFVQCIALSRVFEANVHFIIIPTIQMIQWCIVIDIPCLTRDRDVHHTLRYKRLFNGDVSK